MRYAPFLREHDTIGFPAPSFGCVVEPYHTAFMVAQEKMKDAGYSLEVGPNALSSDGVGISTTPNKCAEEFMDMWEKPQIQAMISCGGGELMCEILDYVDFETVKSQPAKWFMGFSDNTNLVYPLVTMCDTAAIYGPCIASFGATPWHKSQQDAFDLITGKLAHSRNEAAKEVETENPTIVVHSYDAYQVESLRDEEHPTAPINATEKRIHTVYLPKEAVIGATGADTTSSVHVEEGCLYVGEEAPSFTMKGRLVGGCLDCLATLVGTKYDHSAEFAEKYKEDGIIWAIEACELNVFSIRRVLWQMEHAGWFKHVNGFLIGRAENGEAMMNLDVIEAFTPLAKRLGVPMILNADLGHVPPMMPLVMGSLATLESQGNDLTIRMQFS